MAVKLLGRAYVPLVDLKIIQSGNHSHRRAAKRGTFSCKPHKAMFDKATHGCCFQSLRLSFTLDFIFISKHIRWQIKSMAR